MRQFTDPTIPGPADGDLHGDDGAFPNRGTTRGFVHYGEPYGADVGINATNRMGSAHMAPDDMDAGVKNPPQLHGYGHHAGSYRGTEDITDATDSDRPADETPQNPHIGKRK